MANHPEKLNQNKDVQQPNQVTYRQRGDRTRDQNPRHEQQEAAEEEE